MVTILCYCNIFFSFLHYNDIFLSALQWHDILLLKHIDYPKREYNSISCLYMDNSINLGIISH